MKRDLGNFTRGSQLIEHFGFMFAAGLKSPLIISLIVMCRMTWWTVSEGMPDHAVCLAWMHVHGAGYPFMEFDPAHDVTVRTAWGRTVTFPIFPAYLPATIVGVPYPVDASDPTPSRGLLARNRGARSWRKSPCS